MPSASSDTPSLSFAASRGIAVGQPLATPLATSTSPGLGYGMAILSVICNAVAIHSYRYVLEFTNPYTLAPLNTLFGLSAMMVLGWFWRQRGWTLADLHRLSPVSLTQTIRQAGWRMSAMLTAGAFGGLLYLYGISEFGPDTVTFLGNGTVVLLVIAGVFQRENLSRLEFITITMIVVGAFAFSYQGGSVMWFALGVMALSCCGTALKHLGVKKYTPIGGLGTMVAASQLHIGVFIFIVGLLLGKFALPAPGIVALIAVTTLIGPVLGMMLLYGSYSIIGVSRGGSIDAMRPLAVLLISLSLGMADLSLFQTGGGLLMLAGSAMLAAYGVRK